MCSILCRRFVLSLAGIAPATSSACTYSFCPDRFRNLWQSAVSRVSVGHRGATSRKALFESGDEGSSDGIGDSSVGGFEGGCSRAENKARQRSTIIRNVCKNTPVFTTRQDKAEVERRAAAKSVRRSLPEDPNVAVSLVI